MLQHQKMAIENPCYAAEECVDPRFCYSDGFGFVVLTANSGFE